jgi:O-antigen/teichoic acid export membrane protein
VSEVPGDILDTSDAGPKLIRGSVLRIGGHVAGTLVAVVATALMMRHLGVVDAGRLVTVLALTAIVAGVSDLGLTGVGLREYTVLEGAARDRFMRSLLGMRIAYTSVAIGFAVVFSLAVGYPHEMVIGTALAGFGAMLFVLHGSFAIPLSTQLKFGWVTGFQLAIQFLMAAMIAGLVALDAGLVPFLAVQIPAMVPVLAATAVVVRGHTPLRPAFDAAEWRRVMREILPYAAAVAFAVIYFRLVTILVSVLSSERETGFFAASFRVIDALALIPPLLVSTAFPVLARAARDDRERLSYALTRLTEAMLIVGCWIALSVVVGAEFLIEVIAGPDFEPSVPVLRLQGPAILGTCLVAAWGYGLLSLRRHRAILACNLVALTIAAILSVALIEWHGAEGGAVALTVTELALATGYGIALARGDLALGGVARLLPPLALALLAATAVPVLAGLPSLLAILAASAIYFGILLLTRSIPAEIGDAFTSLRRQT